jgi:hypothetical protein
LNSLDSFQNGVLMLGDRGCVVGARTCRLLFVGVPCGAVRRHWLARYGRLMFRSLPPRSVSTVYRLVKHAPAAARFRSGLTQALHSFGAARARKRCPWKWFYYGGCPRLVVVPRAAPRLATSRRWQRCVPRAIETGAFSVSPPTGFSAPSSMAGPTVEKQGALVRLLLPRCRCDRASQVLRRRSAGELARRERSWATPLPWRTAPRPRSDPPGRTLPPWSGSPGPRSEQPVCRLALASRACHAMDCCVRSPHSFRSAGLERRPSPQRVPWSSRVDD